MAEYLSPWVFREERAASAGPVASASTSTYATVGWLQKGPENDPQLITSFGAFVEKFGSYWRNSYVPFMLDGFFKNGGSRAYITRVTPSDASKSVNDSGLDDAATAASFLGRTLASTVDLSTNSYVAISFDGGAVQQIDCVGSTPASTTPTEIASAIDTALTGATATVVSNQISIVSDTPGAASALHFEEATANDATAAILGLDVSGSKSYDYSGEAASDWTATARWNGAWYDLVRVAIAGNPDYEDDNGLFSRYNVYVEAESEAGAADWGQLEVFQAVDLDDDTSDFWVETVMNDKTNYVTLEAGTTAASPRSLRPTYSLAEWIGEGDGAQTAFSGTLRNTTVVEGTLVVVAAGVTATDQGDGTLTGTGIDSATINYDTGAYAITFSVAPVADVQILATYYTPPSSEEVAAQLAGGSDGTGPLTRGDVSDSALQATKAGLYSFDALDEILNISLPDFAGNVTVSNDLIAYAETLSNRYIVLTTPIGTTPADAKKFVRNTAQYNTSFASLYYPWVKIYDPIANDGRNLVVPPDGFVAGVFSRTDNSRNVGKTPAGLTDGKLNGITGLERILDKGERDLVYPHRINPLASSPQTGLAVWGGRTLSRDAEWLNVNARRLFMFCEQSMYDASFWIPFENNGPSLWARVKKQGEGFFLRLFRDGYFRGASPDEAFAIVCDESNNPTESVDAGYLIVDYYIAPNKPAEFVRLRFQQKVSN
jgi:phage tail sheath protein FI